jgi:hypothetical protein
MIFKLKKPTKINGTEISEINLDKLDDMVGDDLTSIEAGFRTVHKEFIPVLNLDTRYHMWIAGRASGINPEDLGKLYAPDYVGLGVAIQSFLTGTG